MQGFTDFVLESGKIAQFTAEEMFINLNLNCHLIQMVQAINVHHKLIANLGDILENMLNLGRENVNAAHRKHIVASAKQTGNLLTATAGTVILHEHGNVSRAIPEKRHCLFNERCHHHLTFFTRTKRLTGLWIDNLYNVAVMPDMQTILFGTLKCNTRTKQLTHTITVVSFDVETVLQVPAHVFGPCLSTKYPYPE